MTFTHILFWNLFRIFHIRGEPSANGKKDLFFESHYVESQRIAQGSASQEDEKRMRFKMKTKNVLMHICKFPFFIVSYFHESSEWIIILFFPSHIHVVCVFYRCLSSSFILSKMNHMSIRFLWLMLLRMKFNSTLAQLELHWIPLCFIQTIIKIIIFVVLN